MKLYTIGFTQKSAREFFNKIKNNNIECTEYEEYRNKTPEINIEDAIEKSKPLWEKTFGSPDDLWEVIEIFDDVEIKEHDNSRKL